LALPKAVGLAVCANGSTPVYGPAQDVQASVKPTLTRLPANPRGAFAVIKTAANKAHNAHRAKALCIGLGLLPGLSRAGGNHVRLILRDSSRRIKHFLSV
jgi:hypothetical protein